MKKDTPFWDVSLPVEKRLDWLLAEMTIEEKLSCLASSVPALERLGIPGMNVGGEAAHGVEARNDQNELKVPEPTTSFVQPIGMSASWDREMIRKAGEVTGIEARVIYHRHPDRGLSRWAPTIDLERDPRWGRNEEGYGEDPVLTGAMASGYIQGMQGDDPHYLRIASTLKHFYGNNVEEGRGWKNSSIDPRNKFELYLEPFRRAIQDGGAEAVMTAYNKINGTPGILNHEVQDILKDQFGLKHAVSDGGAMSMVAGVHHYYGTHAETVANAVKAGVDAMSEGMEGVTEAAKEAWELGLLSEAEIDRAIRNMFRTKLRLGIYDEPVRNPYDRVTEEDLLSEKSREICLQMSREAVVLLKNEDHALPLDASMPAKELAVIGPLADAWYQDWYGGTPPFKRTLKDGIEEILGPGSICADGWDRVVFRCGDKAVAIGEDGTLRLSDQADVFVKETWGEGSCALRSVRTGRLWNLRMPSGPDGEFGRIAADSEQAFDWFVVEIFHLFGDKTAVPKDSGEGEKSGCCVGNTEKGASDCGEVQADLSGSLRQGSRVAVTLTDRFDNPLTVSPDGSIRSVYGAEPAGFVMEVVSSGIEEAKKAAAAAKTVVLALGCHSMIDCKETADRSSIAFPACQQKLFDAVTEVNSNAVTVLFTNFPYAMSEIHQKARAILMSATGAQDMGTAMAETLFGKNAPAGRLNMTWYLDDSQLPDMDDYDIIKGGRTYRYFPGEVLYPFGYGLTYTKFVYSDLTVELKDSREIKASLLVKNAGERASDEVVQLYGIAPPSRVKKPLRQLLAFQRVKAVEPGEVRRVEFSVPAEEFRFYDTISGTLMVEAGRYTIFAGGSSADRQVSAELEIPGLHPGKRDLTKKIRADHYDDYENILLTEGQFGYTAVTPADPEREGWIRFGDCELSADTKKFVLHLKSGAGCSVKVLVDGETAACWEGNTREYRQGGFPAMDEKGRKEAVLQAKTWPTEYTDVAMPVCGTIAEKAVHTVEIHMAGDVRLCYFRC